MTWNVSTQIYSMPSVLDLPSESPPNYNSEQPLRQNDYMFSQSLGQQETIGGRYNTSAFSNISSESGVLGYYPQQYSSSSHHQHPDYRDNSFMWIGASNVYPSSSYDKRYSEDAYIPPRQLLRRHTNSERIEKANNRKRRAPTIAQRRAANIRERRRMYNLNEAFDCLRQRIPTFAYEKRLSRIETLRLAISYISFMARIVNGEDPNTLSVNTYDPQICPSSALTQAELSQSDAISTLHRCDIDDYDEERDEDEEDDTSGADDDATNDVHDQNMNITDRQIDTECDTHNRA